MGQERVESWGGARKGNDRARRKVKECETPIACRIRKSPTGSEAGRGLKLCTPPFSIPSVELCTYLEAPDIFALGDENVDGTVT